MKSRDFCYWLQGWFELNKTNDHRSGASAETLEVIERHLAMVFVHEIDPSFPAEQKSALDKTHQTHKANTDTPGFGPATVWPPHPNEPGGPMLRC